MSSLDFIEQHPKTPATASVIWLHGLGADGHDFADIAPQLQLPPEFGVRFIFPHAPMRAITINGGMSMRGWFDIKSLSLPMIEDTVGIHASARAVEELIAAELRRGISADRIILAGFSQGGAIALHCGLRYPLRLGGLLILSSFLPLAATVPAEKHSANQDLPIFMAHGTQDPILPMVLGEMSRTALQAQGYKIDWQTYPMPHSVCPQEIQDIGQWLRKVLA